MKITNVKTAIKVADIVARNDHPLALVKAVYNPELTKEELTDNAGRVYLIVVDGVIKKIGGSASKGGIKSTIGFYAGQSYTDGNNRFAMHIMLAAEIATGSKVEFYMINATAVKAVVPGLFGEEEMMVSFFKEVEAKCIAQYEQVEKTLPIWNFQERGEKLPANLIKAKTDRTPMVEILENYIAG